MSHFKLEIIHLAQKQIHRRKKTTIQENRNEKPLFHLVKLSFLEEKKQLTNLET